MQDRVLRPDSERTTVATTKCTKGGCKLDGGRRTGLSRRSPRKAPLGQPAFQPYCGKLAVRNDRGDQGNVGIIRSPIRASILPDRTHKLYHRQVYEFAYQRAKLAFLRDGSLDDKRASGTTSTARFSLLAHFLESVHKTCPHNLFQDEQSSRGSQLAPDFLVLDKLIVVSKQNAATEAAALRRSPLRLWLQGRASRLDAEGRYANGALFATACRRGPANKHFELNGQGPARPPVSRVRS
jgi:hypothetical protein